MDIHGKIRAVLAETVRDDQGPAHPPLSEADFLRALQRRGIVDDVMKDLHFTQVGQHFAGNLQIYIPDDYADNYSFLIQNWKWTLPNWMYLTFLNNFSA